MRIDPHTHPEWCKAEKPKFISLIEDDIQEFEAKKEWYRPTGASWPLWTLSIYESPLYPGAFFPSAHLKMSQRAFYQQSSILVPMPKMLAQRLGELLIEATKGG